MDGWMEGWVGGWVDGWLDGWYPALSSPSWCLDAELLRWPKPGDPTFQDDSLLSEKMLEAATAYL